MSEEPADGSLAAEDGLGRKLVTALVVLLVTVVGHRVIGVSMDPTTGHVLRTPLDEAIPFLPWTVHLYSWVYTSMLIPLFTVRSGALFQRVALAYMLVVLVSLATFLIYPVTALGFRPDVGYLDASTFTNWAVKLTFHIDPPTNLFPSLHVSIATIALLSTWKARRIYAVVTSPIALGILVSISTMKQHYVADGIAGMALAAGVYALVLRPFEAKPGAGPVARGWRGPALYLLSHVAFYVAAYCVFLAGVRPWS